MPRRSAPIARFAALALAGAAASASPIQAVAQPLDEETASARWQPNEDDFLLLALTLGKHRLSEDLRGYRTPDGVCVDLADVVQALDLPIRVDRKSRRATGWLFAQDRPFTLDRDSGTVQTVNTGNAPLRGDIHDTPEGWCVETAALGRWFGMNFRTDLYNAAIRLESDRPLPFVEALERRSRAARLRPRRTAFDLSAYPHVDASYRAWRTPSVDTIVTVGYDRRAGGTTRQTVRAESYAAGEIGGASYTARLATDAGLGPSSLRVRAYRRDNDGGLLGPLDATEIAAGDVDTQSGQLTARGAVGRGVVIGNGAHGRGSRFSATTVRGDLPAGWDAELYRNGQLIAFREERGDGRYEFDDVDLFYGENDLEVVLYGPQGQVRRERIDAPVGRSLVEPGKTFWWAGALQQNRDLIRIRARDGPNTFEQDDGAWRMGLGIDHGLDAMTSIGMGYHSLRFDGARRHYLETRVARRFGGLQGELSAGWDANGGSVWQLNAAGGFGALSYGAFATIARGGFRSEFIDADLRRSYGFNADTSLRFGKFSLPIQGRVARVEFRDGRDAIRWSVASSLATHGVHLTARVESDVDRDRGQTPGRGRTDLLLLANTRIFGVRLRGSAGFALAGPNSGFEFANLSIDETLDERTDLSVETEYGALDRVGRLRLGLTRRFKPISIRADASIDSDGNLGGRLSLAFSLGPNPLSGGFRIAGTKLARAGQAAVTVYRDENANGRRDAGEEAIADAGIEAGLRRSDAVTDASGRALVDDLRPFRPVLVGLDEASLVDPFLVPATRGVVVTPRPGVVTTIELPVTPSGEIEGLVLSPAGSALPGVTIELIDARGAVVASAISEYDGFLLFARVPYGKYGLRVAEKAARTLDLESALPIAISIDADADIARLGAIRLVAGRTIASTRDQTIARPR